MTSRHAITAVTLLVLVGVLLAGAYVGSRALFAPLPSDGAAASGCEEGLRRGERVRPRDVTVSVYNAGTRSGLADRTQEQLVGRGFVAGEVDNAPEGAGVRLVRVLAPRRDDPAARLVALQFGRRTPVQVSRDDLGPGVEVLVGDRFRRLVEAPQVIRASRSGSGC